MGHIKYGGNIIYSGPLAHVSVNDGWNNSMAEYYPSVSYVYTENGDIKTRKVEVVGGFAYPVHFDEVVVDSVQVMEVERIRKVRAAAIQSTKIEMHKNVRVVLGRKVPIGTEGEVMWMGDKGWGPSVGIRKVDGSVVFTASKNVEVITMDTLFDDLLTDSDSK